MSVAGREGVQAGFDGFSHWGLVESKSEAGDCIVGVGQGEGGCYCQRAGSRGG